MLSPVQSHPSTRHPDLIVGLGTGDDAGVYAIGDGRALVHTVDVFAPVVDSAGDWGEIAAVNALSDIYAMGAEPLTALQYLAWPRDELPFELASDVIRGGMDVMAKAGCTVVGGHSIDGPEPHYGFAVTGVVNVDDVLVNSGGRPGDALVLTKPLGTGIIATAIKRGSCPAEIERSAIEVMKMLNRDAGLAARELGASAVTDVTGFGLLGHLREMCVASNAGARVRFDQVPLLDGVGELLADGMWPGGSRRNLLSIAGEITTQREDEEIKLLVDAQTSGGLLVALPREQVDGYLERVNTAVEIGELTSSKFIEVV